MTFNDELKTGNAYPFNFEAPEGGLPLRGGSYVPSEPPKRKKRAAAKVVALCLICALLGGIAGGAIMALYWDNPADMPPLVITPGPAASNTANTRPEDGEVLTAAQVYVKGVISCVSINSTVTEARFNNPLQSKVSGSGFIISADGYVITNYHVINGVDNGSIKVTLYDGRTFDASVVGYDEPNDLAVLKINATGLTPVDFGSSNSLFVGDPIYTIGDPLGTLSYTMTQGIVSALDRVISTESTDDINTFQIDAAVNSGNSGGPVFNSYGQVVGIVTAKYSETGVEGLGFAIPIDNVYYMINDIIEYGFAKSKPYMGVTVMTASEEEYAVRGALIYSVDVGGAAEKAGIRKGDIVVEMNGRKITSLQDLLSARTGYRAGETVSLKIYRGGEYLTLELTFAEAPRR